MNRYYTAPNRVRIIICIKPITTLLRNFECKSFASSWNTFGQKLFDFHRMSFRITGNLHYLQHDDCFLLANDIIKSIFPNPTMGFLPWRSTWEVGGVFKLFK